MIVKVRGKTYTIDAAIDAVKANLFNTCKNGHVKITDVPPEMFGKSKNACDIYLLNSGKPISYVIIDKLALKVLFYDLAKNITDTMTFEEYLIDTDYNR